MIVADTISAFTYLPTGADWIRILPELILLVTALVVLLADLAGVPGHKPWLPLLSLAGVIGAGVATGWLWANGDYGTAFFGMMSADKLALFADMVVLFAVGLGLLYSPGYIGRQGIRHQGEYYALMLLAALGMMLMPSADNLMIVFVGLEVLSLALYILCAYVVARNRSQEAGMKYFILSSFASAFLLYGMAMTYGSTGTTSLAGIRAFLANPAHPLNPLSGFGPLLLIGLGLMAVGFAFKVSAIPFQAWTPDVYVGAPTTVTAFMSVGTKVAAFVALARVFLIALGPVQGDWTPVFWVIAVLTLIGGNFLAITQRDVKRMLAYSSVANAGYMLVAIVTNTSLSLASLLVYLAAFAAMNLGAFGVVLALERNDGLGTSLEDYNGLARRRPIIAAVMAICLFSLAGIPPTVGFAGKWYIFYAAIVGNHLELAIIGLVASVAGMFYYLRVVWAMYFVEPQLAVAPASVAVPSGFVVAAAPPAVSAVPAPVVASGAALAVAEPQAQSALAVAEKDASTPVPDTPSVRAIPAGTWLALALATILTLALGIIPGGLYDFATQAATAIFK